MNRLLDKYKSEVISALTQKFSYKNVMQVPKLEKIVINIACGDAVGNSKALDAAINDLSTISGQKPVITRQEFFFRRGNFIKRRWLIWLAN